MTRNLLVTDAKALLQQGLPILDVRAPQEYRQGHMPSSCNLPLLNDEERHLVGLCYKNHGQQQAIALGHRLVQGALKEARLEAWQKQLRSNPQSIILCWRGGLRSTLVQQWLEETGFSAARMKGGYQALRHCALEALDGFPGAQRCLVLAGRTGSGKTLLLQDFSQSIDLEGLANHRGSSFGAQMTAQPAPATFENALAVEYLQKAWAPWLLLEDEGRTIGRLGLPKRVIQALAESPLVLLEVALSQRTEVIYHEYVRQPLHRGVEPHTLIQRYLQALNRIQQRLGGQRHRQLSTWLNTAFQQGVRELHLHWIKHLLQWYYDPMYDYQLKGKEHRIVFRGDTASIRTFLKNESVTTTSITGRENP